MLCVSQERQRFNMKAALALLLGLSSALIVESKPADQLGFSWNQRHHHHTPYIHHQHSPYNPWWQQARPYQPTYSYKWNPWTGGYEPFAQPILWQQGPTWYPEHPGTWNNQPQPFPQNPGLPPPGQDNDQPKDPIWYPGYPGTGLPSPGWDNDQPQGPNWYPEHPGTGINQPQPFPGNPGLPSPGQNNDQPEGRPTKPGIYGNRACTMTENGELRCYDIESCQANEDKIISLNLCEMISGKLACSQVAWRCQEKSPYNPYIEQHVRTSKAGLSKLKKSAQRGQS